MKIRIGNDIKLEWAIVQQDGSTIDLSVVPKHTDLPPKLTCRLPI